MVSRERVSMVNIKDQNFNDLWSPLCSVGRITGRLPKELADEVVQSLLEFFR